MSDISMPIKSWVNILIERTELEVEQTKDLKIKELGMNYLKGVNDCANQAQRDIETINKSWTIRANAWREQREQLEAEIEKLKNINKVMNDQLMKNSVADLTGVVKDIKTQDPREQLIKELKPIYDNLNDWIGQQECYASVYTIDDKTFGDLCYIRDLFEAKLDLLEKGGAK